LAASTLGVIIAAVLLVALAAAGLAVFFARRSAKKEKSAELSDGEWRLKSFLASQNCETVKEIVVDYENPLDDSGEEIADDPIVDAPDELL
jgi:hypothetical protein